MTQKALQARADEVQREMVRYCAGLDRWDEMPVIVEGWLRVFEQLQAAGLLWATYRPQHHKTCRIKKDSECSCGLSALLALETP
jgi:hypothetical protein